MVYSNIVNELLSAIDSSNWVSISSIMVVFPPIEKEPNDHKSFLETFYEVVAIIERFDNTSPTIKNAVEAVGSAEKYTIAEAITIGFEYTNNDRFWDGEFWEEVEAYTKKFLQVK